MDGSRSQLRKRERRVGEVKEGMREKVARSICM